MSTQAKGVSVSVGKQAGATSVFEKQPSPVSQNGEEGVSELPTQPDEKLPSKTWGVFSFVFTVSQGALIREKNHPECPLPPFASYGPHGSRWRKRLPTPKHPNPRPGHRAGPGRDVPMRLHILSPRCAVHLRLGHGSRGAARPARRPRGRAEGCDPQGKASPGSGIGPGPGRAAVLAEWLETSRE